MTRVHSTEPIATFDLKTEASAFSDFFSATGWQSPSRPPCPPTFATLFREGEFKALQKLGIPLQRVLHGEQKYRFLKELKAGESYSGKTFLNNHSEKSGGTGKMAIYLFQTNIVDSASDVCMECLTTIIVRG